jgi:two-component system nitrogen regulation sensor histidine kinase NtrY
LPDQPSVLLCDRRLLAQAVTNLVKNASEAIDSAFEADPSRSEKGHVVIKVRSKGDRLQISVIDNGCGLPKENRQRLVEPYMTTRAKGTGLGLAIVHRITEQHGGTLQLADAPKRGDRIQGASVRMDLPIREGEEAVPAGESEGEDEKRKVTA